MSISRKNWSALSSLTRQWTMEDEEEVEREKRRRVRGSNSTADPDADFSPIAGDTSTSDSTSETNSTSEMSQELSSTEQMNQDFVEMLRVRDEKRRRRHVEALRRQKELEEEQGGVFSPVTTASKPQPLLNTVSHSTSTNAACTQHENGESSRKDPEPTPSSNQNRTFVSSVSISLDKGPSTSRCSTPMSPRSPTTPSSSEDRWPSPCQSPSLSGPWSPVHNGHRSKENGSSPDCNFEQTDKPAFIRQSSRTVSFRMMRKKEEESAPLQRSASVRAASKKFESNTYQSEDEDKASTFQRNSKQRISSKSIQEKMERLAQAAQKSEMIRSPDVTQRTLFRMDEVSRKRDLFEKEQQAASPTSPGVSRQEFRSFTSGMSDRINRWLNKAKQTGSSHSPVDLRHVDITSKKSLFESSGEENPSSGMPMIEERRRRQPVMGSMTD